MTETTTASGGDGGSDGSGVGSIDDARREMYRRQILQAAEVEFSRGGFANAKMSAIAKTADLSLATVYKHFGGKAEIWDDLHALRMADLLAQVEREREHGSSVLDQVLTGIAAVARYLTSHDSYLDMNLRTGAGWASSAPSALGVQHTVWSAGLDAITGGIERAVTSGEIPAISPRVAAGLIVSSLHVWLAEWVQAGRAEDPGQMIDAMIQRLRWMLAGVP